MNEESVPGRLIDLAQALTLRIPALLREYGL